MLRSVFRVMTEFALSAPGWRSARGRRNTKATLCPAQLTARQMSSSVGPWPPGQLLSRGLNQLCPPQHTCKGGWVREESAPQLPTLKPMRLAWESSTPHGKGLRTRVVLPREHRWGQESQRRPLGTCCPRRERGCHLDPGQKTGPAHLGSWLSRAMWRKDLEALFQGSPVCCLCATLPGKGTSPTTGCSGATQEWIHASPRVPWPGSQMSPRMTTLSQQAGQQGPHKGTKTSLQAGHGTGATCPGHRVLPKARVLPCCRKQPHVRHRMRGLHRPLPACREASFPGTVTGRAS